MTSAHQAVFSQIAECRHEAFREGRKHPRIQTTITRPMLAECLRGLVLVHDPKYRDAPSEFAGSRLVVVESDKCYAVTREV